MFGIPSDETLETTSIDTNYKAWDAHLAHIWYNLLHYCTIQANSTIIEVAPGKSTKIAEALEKIVFRGDIYLIEPHKDLGQAVYHLYQERLPQATIYLYQCPLKDALTQLPKQADALLSNHSLDDMLLAETIYTREDLFDWAARGNEQSIAPYQHVWQQLKNAPEELSRCIKSVQDLWCSTIERLEPKKVLLSQYASYHMALHDLDDLNHQASAILHRLQQIYASRSVSQPIIQTILNSMKHYDHPHIGLNVLDSKNWLILT